MNNKILLLVSIAGMVTVGLVLGSLHKKRDKESAKITEECMGQTRELFKDMFKPPEFTE